MDLLEAALRHTLQSNAVTGLVNCQSRTIPPAWGHGQTSTDGRRRLQIPDSSFWLPADRPCWRVLPAFRLFADRDRPPKSKRDRCHNRGIRDPVLWCNNHSRGICLFTVCSFDARQNRSGIAIISFSYLQYSKKSGREQAPALHIVISYLK